MRARVLLGRVRGSGRGPAALGLLLLAAGGCSSATTLHVTIEPPTGVVVRALLVHVVFGSFDVTQAVPAASGAIRLPGTVVVVLPDQSVDVAVELTGTD